MSTVRCACGANLRIAPELLGRSLRCPRCKGEVQTTVSAATLAAAPSDAATPVDGAAAPSTVSVATLAVAPSDAAMPVDGAAVPSTATDAHTALTCPICLTAFQRGEALHHCPECDQLHHEECWSEIGGCGTFGCKQAPAADKSDQSQQAPLTAWGDTKACPVCGETIKSIALKCRYCSATFNTVDPLTASDLRRDAQENQQLAAVKQFTVGLFAVSLLGCLAPIVAIIAAAYVIPKRRQLAKCGPLYKIMGWTSLVLSLIYTGLIIAFVVVDS